MLLLLLLSNYIKAKEAISFEDGNRLYRKIYSVIKSKKIIRVDFSEIDFVTAPFLNAAFGQLYEHFTESEINDHLIITNLNESAKQLLDDVVLRAKEFYSNPGSFNEIANNIIYGV
ncbi:MAG: STAS-like domain-containing protein [Bacteroidales bacterium]|nr:STAS-like domain-containing protein [Bacteroidales bacterium]